MLDSFFPTIYDKDVAFTGLTEELFSMYVTQLHKQQRNIIIMTASLIEANNLFSSLANYTDQVLLFPMDDFLTSEAIAISPDLMISRLETLQSIETGEPKIIITNLMGYLRFLPVRKLYQQQIISLKEEQEIPPKKLVQQLAKIGYNRQSLVTKTAEFGERGFVVDVFPIGEDHPIRIEFFGDTIDSIRYFDEKNQRSIAAIKKIDIYPATEILADCDIPTEKMQAKYLPLYTKVANIAAYLPDVVTIYKDIEQIKTSYYQLQTEIMEYQQSKDSAFQQSYMFSFESLMDEHAIEYLTLDNISPSKKRLIDFQAKEIPSFQENQEAIEKFLRQQLNDQKTVVICLPDYQLQSLQKKLHFSFVVTDINHLKPASINLVSYDMSKGFIYQNYVILTANELFQTQTSRKKYKTKFKYASKITDINKLEIGDYVVHQIHGIGQYNGLTTLEQGGIKKDYLEVLYQGNDKLYIPVEKIELLSKYTGKEGVAPTIYRLGGTQWGKVKQRVKKKVQDMAAELLHLQAERESRKGFSFSKDTELQREFEEAFPYIPTNDQLLATSQIKKDMERPIPMDRLLVGDVGYGKTEVAFRAIFKAIMDNKQVLLLCPTTILSKQHYDNAIERFKDFPVTIGLLNRFTSPKEEKQILNQLATGTIDLVIGTHRLLSDDIKPKNLGLLIIDEEQRFGVKHKEKLKQYKSNIDVLTLTATPIPRTLQMSIVGLRSLSLIETPPVDRYPVQTYVIPENRQLIREAIVKELSRGGQVFFLFNSVEHIEQKVFEIEMLVPEARVIYAHGQMNKEEIENRMIQFVNHEADILVCTTIIETGIDIPNVNTLIILNSDRFGLSQLYQIRGRVGRSNKIAYCYLMYTPNKILTETAVKRLNVIKEFTELGSGFSIATRDLSIRGAGDILGKEQAGFIDSVGIDLYLKLLNEEVARLKGLPVSEPETEEAQSSLLQVSTHISDSYVADTDLKIEIHRLINEIDSKEKLEETRKTLEDRFGKLEPSLIIYMYEEWFEKMVQQIPVTKVRQTRNSIELYFNKQTTEKIDTEQLFLNAFHINTMFRFKSHGDDLTIILDTIKLEKHPIFYLTALLSTLL